jgi:hypothetical protein
LCLCLALALICTRALAADTHAYDLYAQGKYSEAQAAGEAQGDAAGYALAARAGLAAEMMAATPCLECLKKTESEARRAIALDPKQPEGHIYLAATFGYEARLEGLIAARMNDYPGQARKHLDAALAIDPNNCWALAALGAWNLEIVRGGGSVLARLFYGATEADGQAYFAKAFAAAPDNLVLRYQYALTLAGYDLDRFRSQVEDALSRAATLKPGSAYEIFAQNRARELLAALKRNDLSAFAWLVHRDQGYP